ncbi:hypothetical protein [Dyadobacter sp. CY323]|uniref:hypothetical protein n=1 Tax=Dyadobacter sp. CY323 TaxID=2907302 RepID=UPI001F363738|nr:hypothetical protein [Dyadobacter sp. CY323]MCE6992109.1 hypothetical protein [Dyadobacter sp. CY323]
MKRLLSFLLLLVSVGVLGQTSNLPSSMGTFTVFKNANAHITIIKPTDYTIPNPFVEIWNNGQKLSDSTSITVSNDTVRFSLTKKQLAPLSRNPKFFIGQVSGVDTTYILGANIQPTIDVGVPTALTKTITLPGNVVFRVNLIGDAAEAIQASISAKAAEQSALTAKAVAEAARDAALIQPGLYATEALGRAAVADGQPFKVQGAGDMAAFEYRRISSSVSTLITTYPSSSAVDNLTQVSVGRLTRNLPVPLTFTRYLSTGVATTAGNMVQVKSADRSVSVTGFTDQTTNSLITDMQTGVSSSGLTKVSLEFTPSSLVTTDPHFGIGFVSGADRIIFLWRNTGQLSYIKAGLAPVNTMLNADVIRDYVATNQLKMELVFGGASTTINLYISGILVTTTTSSFLPTGDLIIGGRGSMNLVYTLTTEQNSGIPAALNTARAYTDAQIAPIDVQLASLEDKVSVSSVSLAGQVTPTAGVASGTVRTRFDAQPIPALTGTIKISQLKVQVAVAGTGRVKVISPNGPYFAEEYGLSHVFTTGENILPGSLFSSWVLEPGWYIAFEPTGTMQFSDIVGGGGNSWAIFGDITSVAAVGSSYILQYRADLVASTYINEIIGNLTAGTVPAFYVSDATGNDTNDGLTESTPFKTIGKGISSCVARPPTQVVVSGGSYYETLDMSMIVSGHIRIVAKNNEVVRVMGSQKLTGWTKTSGRTNIYEASFAGTIPTWAHTSDGLPRIFEDKNPSKLIPDAEVHPLQKGLTHRLPYTEIGQVVAGVDLPATLTALDAAPGKYYLSGGKVYLNASGSTNPASNGFDYHIPVRATNIVPSSGNPGALARVDYENIRFMFSTSGLISSGFSLVTRINCTAMGVVDANGGFRDDGAHVISYKDEAAGCSNDGFNQHYDAYNGNHPTDDLRRGVGLGIYYEVWAHDNGDDGMSGHIRSEITVYGGLSENNTGGGGFTPANGGGFKVYNALARTNSIGFSMTNSSAGSGRNHTSLLAVNCYAINNTVGFQNNSESGAIMDLRNCVARESSVFNYRATSAGAILNASNCLSSHTNSAKHKSAGTGTINVINDPVLAP